MSLASVLLAVGLASQPIEANALFQAEPYLPPAPRQRAPQSLPSAKAVSIDPKALSIDPSSRSDVARAYQQSYLAQAGVGAGWNGNVAACNAGTTATAYRTAVMERINFYRALAGVPGVIVHSADSTISANAQQAALMMSAQGALSHSPANSWACYSVGGASGAGGAGSSNLALGRSGAAAIDLYMVDPGSGNAAVGHRRWLLYPPRLVMASGDIPSGTQANALYVFGSNGARPATPLGVAWPPRGFVPYQVLPASSNRWSLSYPGANFSAAVVSMRVNGELISSVVDSRSDNGYGDNTLVWRPATGSNAVVYGATGVNRSYEVSVSGISGSGVPNSLSYTVTVIDGLEAFTSSSAFFINGFE